MAISRRGPRVKRPLDWYAGYSTSSPYSTTATGAADSASQAALITLANAAVGSAAHEQYIYELGEQTVTRILGDLFVTAVKSTNTSQQGILFFGIHVVPWEAYLAGSASMPSPYSDPEADWLYWRSLFCGWRVFTDIEAASGDTHLGGDQDFQRVFVDTRAQRKMRKGELPVALWYWKGVANAPGYALQLGLRCLLKK